jgi:ankyrin repeat protein
MSDETSNFWLAILDIDVEKVSFFIKRGIDVNRKHPLMRAASNGSLEIMTLLLDTGADIDAVDDKGFSACREAIVGNHFDALKLLVDRGANVRVIDAKGNSLFAVARPTKGDKIVNLLLDAGVPLDDKFEFDLIKSAGVLSRLLGRGLNVMRKDYGETLWHSLASRPYDVEDLVRALANVWDGDVVGALNEDCWQGKTPIHLAASTGNLSTLRVFVELGADIDRQVRGGPTPLLRSLDRRVDNGRITEFLLALGADVRLTNTFGETACHFALGRINRGALQALLAAGGDIDVPCGNGKTPRNVAADMGIAMPSAADIDAARVRMAKTRLDLVRRRALEICIGIHMHCNNVKS